MAPWSHITPKGGERLQVREGGAPYPRGAPRGQRPCLGGPNAPKFLERGGGSWKPSHRRDAGASQEGADHPPWAGRLGLQAPLRGPNMPKFLQQGVGSRKPSHEGARGGHPPWAGPSPPGAGWACWPLDGPLCFTCQSSSYQGVALGGHHTEGTQGRARGGRPPRQGLGHHPGAVWAC